MAEFDYMSGRSSLDRRAKILEALQSQAMAPLQQTVVGGMVAPTSSTQAVSKILESLIARNAGKKQDAREAEFQRQANAQLAEGLDKFARTSQGQQWQSGVLKPGVNGELQSMSTPANPRQAILDAMASGHPILQQFGLSQMSKLEPERLSLKDLAGMATGESVLANPSNPAAWQPKRDIRQFTPGSVLADESGNVTSLRPGAGGEPAYETVMIGGDLYQKTSTGLKKLDEAPRTTINNNMNPENAFGRKIADILGGSLEQTLQNRLQAEKMLVVADQLEAMDAAGMVGGPLASTATFLGSLAESVGMSLDEETKAKLANTEGYTQVLAKQVADVLTAGAGVGRSMTDADREWFLKQFPQVSMTPEGRQKAVEILRGAARRDIQYADSAIQRVEAQFPQYKGMLSAFPSGWNSIQPSAEPQPAAQPDTGVLTLEEYMRRIQGGQ